MNDLRWRAGVAVGSFIVCVWVQSMSDVCGDMKSSLTAQIRQKSSFPSEGSAYSFWVHPGSEGAPSSVQMQKETFIETCLLKANEGCVCVWSHQHADNLSSDQGSREEESQMFYQIYHR